MSNVSELTIFTLIYRVPTELVLVGNQAGRVCYVNIKRVIIQLDEKRSFEFTETGWVSSFEMCCEPRTYTALQLAKLIFEERKLSMTMHLDTPTSMTSSLPDWRGAKDETIDSLPRNHEKPYVLFPPFFRTDYFHTLGVPHESRIVYGGTESNLPTLVCARWDL
jgi:hypothetical protein